MTTIKLKVEDNKTALIIDGRPVYQAKSRDDWSGPVETFRTIICKVEEENNEDIFSRLNDQENT